MAGLQPDSLPEWQGPVSERRDRKTHELPACLVAQPLGLGSRTKYVCLTYRGDILVPQNDREAIVGRVGPSSFNLRESNFLAQRSCELASESAP